VDFKSAGRGQRLVQVLTGRPPLAPGEHGRISFKNLKNGKVRARVVLRDVDGATRDLVATAATRGAADRKLKAGLKARTVPSAMGITAKMRVADLCDYFLEQRLKQTFTAAEPKEKKKSGRGKGKKMPLKPQTVAAYAAVVRSTIKPTLGALRLQEVSVGRLDTVLSDLEHSGVSTGQMRSVLSQIFRMAVRHGVLSSNPMALVEPMAREEHEVEALELEGVYLLRHLVSPETQRKPGRRRPNRDLCEYVDVALGTGARISEVLALRWEHLDLDSDIPTVLINGTLVEPRKGYVEDLHRQEHTKNRDIRLLILPDQVVATLRARRARAKHNRDSDPVFASRNGTWLWPNNIRTRLRAAISETDLLGATPHTLRRTVGTKIAHEVSLDAARDQLGHAHPGVTGRHYVARRKLGPDVRGVLDQFLHARPAHQFGGTGDAETVSAA
jgi:integrase